MTSFKVLVYGQENQAVNDIEHSLLSANFIIEKAAWHDLPDTMSRFKPDLLILNFKEVASCDQINSIPYIGTIPYILITSTFGIEYFARICNAAAYVNMPLDTLDFINTVKDVLSI